MNDKKKLMIIGALTVVMLGVGAFQFMGGSAQPEPVSKGTTTKNDAKLTAVSDTETAPKVSSPGGNGPKEVTQNSVTTDPDVAKSPEGTDTGVSIEASAEMVVDPMLVAAAKLSPRDPFDGVTWDLEKQAQIATKPVSTPNYSKPTPGPRIRRPGGMDGQLRPFPVGSGEILPDVTGTGGQPNGQMPSYDDVPYKVNGVINGSRPAVVVSDSTGGSQRLVRVGSKLDAETEVIGIQRGKMIVRKHGKVKTISIEEGGAPKEGGKSPENK